MDEGGEGKAAADGVDLSITGENVRRLMMAGMTASMRLIEADMHRLYRRAIRRIWIARAFVLLNLAVIAWDWSRGWSWVLLITPGNAWAAWYSFTNAEMFAGDLPHMRTALADIAKKIKLAEGIANESRA
jgi:hypothetical protein